MYRMLVRLQIWLVILIVYTTTTTTTTTTILVSANDFEPYELNGGLVSAVAGKNYCIIAADTRMIGPGGYLLQSRNHLSSRLWSVDDDSLMKNVEESLRSDNYNNKYNNFKTTKTTTTILNADTKDYDVTTMTMSRRPTTTTTATTIRRISPSSPLPVFIGSSGCTADCTALQRVIRADLRAAAYMGQTIPSKPKQVATLLSQILYLRRGFPYYSFCVLSGMDVDKEDEENGMGQVFVYDAIGSFEQVAVAAAGTGREALQPILDRLFTSSTTTSSSSSSLLSKSSSSSSSSSRVLQVEQSVDQAIETLCNAYRSVSEREIGVGDKLVMHILEKTSSGDFDSRVIVLPLKEH